jgi:beta-mannanase
MKKTVFHFFIFFFVLLIALYVVNKFNFFRLKQDNPIEINLTEPVLAVFSFNSNTPNQIVNIPHYTIRLSNFNDWDLIKSEIAHFEDSILLLLTIEIWSKKNVITNLNSSMEDLLEGKLDHDIKQLCINLIGNRPNVFLRFNPEMEVPANRYPWQKSGSPAYIEAFRHFSSLCNSFVPQVKQMWGPAGYPGAEEYYPGDDVVDAASITLKSDSEIQLNVYPKTYPVEYDLFRRLHRLRFIDKPVFVLGSKQILNDSINERLISSITKKINQEKDVIYSDDNFERLETKYESNSPRKIEIGLYDPQSFLNKEKPVTVEHIFANFDDLIDETLQNKFNQIIDRGHDIIITIEPGSNNSGLKSDSQILQQVTEGKYDAQIAKLYSIILKTNRRVYLRYAQEMEIPITRYQWQSRDPLDYIKSYRYFMTFIDSLPPNIFRVWGPAGDRGALEWWPGNDVVDFISFAIYGLPDKNIRNPKKQESFETIYNRKYRRIRLVDKPIFITEFGVKGAEEYQTKWLEAAAKVIRVNPQIIGINYFNMSDVPLAWGEMKPPDWSITKKSFYRFVDVLNEE